MGKRRVEVLNEFPIFGKILSVTLRLHYFRKLHSIFMRSFCPISGLINEVKYRSSPRGVVKFSNQNKSIETHSSTTKKRRPRVVVLGLVKITGIFFAFSLLKTLLTHSPKKPISIASHNVSLFWKEETTDASTSTMEKRFKDLDFLKANQMRSLMALFCCRA